MGRKRYTVEQIIRKLREAEVELAKGSKTPQVCRKLGISEQTYYRWRKQYGGMQVNQARRLKELERENARLKKLLAEAMLDNAILKEASSGNFRARRGVAGRWRTCASAWRSPSVGRAGFWGSRAARSATAPEPRMTRLVWWRG